MRISGKIAVYHGDAGHGIFNEELKDFIQIYTEGSKDHCKCDYVVYENHFISKMRLPDNASIFS